jgi:AcrR family transcriptional regulator
MNYIERMSTKTPATQRNRSPRPERGDVTKEKLLSAAIDVFGRYGFDGTTTRALADAAGVNLQAIPYYFTGKEGLYIAAAEHIASLVIAHTAAPRDRVRARLARAEKEGKPIAVAEARALLGDLLQTMAILFVSSESESWARFLIREQMAPTEAFTRVYASIIKPMIEVSGRLVAILLAEDAASEHVRLRTLSLLGGVMIFRIAHAAVLAHLDWKKIDGREVDIIRDLAGELVASIDRTGAAR